MALYGSTNTRAGSGGRNASGGCRCWVKARSLNFLNQLKFKYENGKFKRKADPGIAPRGGPPALYTIRCHSFET